MPPRPKPTALKLVDGTRKSRIASDEPQAEPVPGDLEPPAWLSEVGKGYWRDLAPKLADKRVLTEFDIHGLGVLCQALDMHERASTLMNDPDASIISQGDRGRVLNVALRALRDQASIIRQWSIEFGMTPSSRSSVKVPVKPAAQEARKLLSG